MSDELNDNPSIAELRREFNQYLIAAQAKNQTFQVHRGITPIGILGPVHKLPEQFKARVRRVSFLEVRDKTTNITSAMLRGRALVIEKMAKGRSASKNRGRRKFARVAKEVAAIWPFPESARRAEELQLQQQILKKVDKLTSDIAPIVQLLQEKKIIEQDIAEKRRQSENLDKTMRRIIGAN
jgi:hypothetical protein